jgi:hypothetical protein
MKLYKHFPLLILLCFFAFLVISNPSELTYLNRVSVDYAQYHPKMDIPTEVLQQVGQSNRTTYLFFSTYDYRFGNMQVFYFGVANSIYYLGLQRKKSERRPIKVV